VFMGSTTTDDGRLGPHRAQVALRVDWRTFSHPDCYRRLRSLTGSASSPTLAGSTAGQELGLPPHHALKAC
jgi:hypothetical protein